MNNPVPTQVVPVARGFVRKPGRVSLVVTFDAGTFGIMRRRALAENTSVGEQVRTLVEWGLESAKENCS